MVAAVGVVVAYAAVAVGIVVANSADVEVAMWHRASCFAAVVVEAASVRVPEIVADSVPSLQSNSRYYPPMTILLWYDDGGDG